MKERLSDLVRRVLFGSALLSGASAPVGASPPPEAPSEPVTPTSVSEVNPLGVVVLRESRPRLILKRATETIMELVSSHRSHRSHSSHRSHYSSSAPSQPATPRTRPDTSVPIRKDAPGIAAPALGSRMLVLGMKGSDVMAMMRLLVAHQYLKREEVSRDSVFTKQVETAVKMFQVANGLDGDGKVGPAVVLLLKRAP